MYTTNHGPIKILIQLQEEKIQASIQFKYTCIYLHKLQKISMSPTITLIYPTTPLD